MRAKKMLPAALLIMLFVLPRPAAGGEPDSIVSAVGPILQSAVPTAIEMPTTGGLLALLILSLIVVLALIWGAMYLLRRISGRGAPGLGKSHVRVLERAHIAPKKAVYVIQVGSRALAVGVSEAGMSTLAELDPDETLKAYPAFQEQGAPSSFAHLLGSMRTRFRGKVVVEGRP